MLRFAVVTILGLFGILLANPALVNAQNQACWVQEIHYNNILFDNNEFIEIACRTGIDVSEWQIYLYRNGLFLATVLDEFTFGELDPISTGLGITLYVLEPNRIPRGGVVLADANADVVEFISYGGSFTASNGIVRGRLSTDIGVREEGFARASESLQLSGSGCTPEDFTWQEPQAFTIGAVNIGQTVDCDPLPTVAPSTSTMPSVSPSPTAMPSASTCFFSCQDGLVDGGWTESGLYKICPNGQGTGEQITVYCDQETAEGGWTLLLSYDHSAGSNEELVLGTIPIDPRGGYSHVNVNDINGYELDDIDAVRFYCETSSHDRIVHFVSSNRTITSIAFDGDQSLNYPEAWNSDVELLSDHTGFLPVATDSVDQLGDGGLTWFPFWADGSYHWAVRGALFRWECDDFVDSSDEDTRHLVWARLRRQVG